VGEVELEDNVLVIRRIRVRLTLKTDESNWETASRVHGLFADKCPIYLSLKAAIQITTELVLEPADTSSGFTPLCSSGRLR
jgi:uncharacterized OsmC-like protein